MPAVSVRARSVGKKGNNQKKSAGPKVRKTRKGNGGRHQGGNSKKHGR